MSLYLIHFGGGHLGTSGRNSARHYLGFAPDGQVAARVAEHQRGTGAKITAAAVARGLTLELAATLPGDRTRERQLKRNGHLAQRCPLCTTTTPATRGDD